jgi:MoxR-like ATPase
MLQRAARVMAAAEGRDYVVPDDVKGLAVSVLSHRVITSSDAQLSGVSSEMLVADVVDNTPVPKKARVTT